SLLLLKQLHHLANRRLRGDYKRGVGSHSNPVRRRLAPRPIQLYVLPHHELQTPTQIRLDRRLIDLTVALRRVSVADFEQCAFYEDRNVERRSSHQLLVVEIARMARRWIAAHSAECGRGSHADRAQAWSQRDD